MKELSSSTMRVAIKGLFERPKKPGGTSDNNSSTVAKAWIERLGQSTAAIATAANHSDEFPTALDLFPESNQFSQAQILTIQRKLTDSAGELKQLHEPMAKSVYFVSESEDAQLINAVQIECEFDNLSEPVNLTFIFDDEDKIRCLDFSEINSDLIFYPETKEDDKHVKSLARLIIYELAYRNYGHVIDLYTSSYREGLNLDSLKEAFKGCDHSSLELGDVISEPMSENKQMVNLSVSFNRQNRQPFDHELSLLFNSDHELESIMRFED